MYTMSEKRKLADLKKWNIEKRIKIFTWMKGGMKSKEVAKRLGCTRQSVEYSYKRISNLTLDELNKLSIAIDK